MCGRCSSIPTDHLWFPADTSVARWRPGGSCIEPLSLTTPWQDRVKPKSGHTVSQAKSRTLLATTMPASPAVDNQPRQITTSRRRDVVIRAFDYRLRERFRSVSAQMRSARTGPDLS
jgi:hypothetical protein